MRRSRRLTGGERWELGVFLGILTLACAGLTILFHFDGIPTLAGWAFGPNAVIAPNPAPAASAVAAQPATQIPLPQPRPTLAPDNFHPIAFSPPAVAPAAKPKPVEDVRWYKGVKYKYRKTMKLRVTAYAPDPRCCWPFPGTTTASGLSVKTNHGKLVAADPNVIPLHALVSVPGYSGGAPVPVLDTGGAIKGSRLDVLLPTFNQAKDWGTRTLEVKIYMPVD